MNFRVGHHAIVTNNICTFLGIVCSIRFFSLVSLTPARMHRVTKQFVTMSTLHSSSNAIITLVMSFLGIVGAIQLG